MSRKNTDIVEIISPIPNANKNKQINANGKHKYAHVIGAPVIKTINNKGIKDNNKFIPTNKHFDRGNIYFGMYTLVINWKLNTIEVIADEDASLK